MTDLFPTIEALYSGPDPAVYLIDTTLGDYDVAASKSDPHTSYVSSTLAHLRSLTDFMHANAAAPDLLDKIGRYEGVVKVVLSCIVLLRNESPNALPAPWATPDISAAASALLRALAAAPSLLSGGPSGRFPELLMKDSEAARLFGSEAEAALQRLLVRLSRVALSALGPAIESGRAHDYDKHPDLPIDSAFSPADRLLASQRLCRLLEVLQGPGLSLVLNETPALVFAADCWTDASPRVQLRGARALHRAALEGTGNDLRPFRDALLPIVTRGIEGGDGATWSARLAAAVALIVSLEGPDPRSEGYGALMKAILTEAEVRGENAVKRASVLAALPPLCEVLGLTMCRYLGRLLPLLCEWLPLWHEPTVQALALDAWIALIRVTWPRLAPHAPHMLAHLLCAYAATCTGAPPLPPSMFLSIVAGIGAPGRRGEGEEAPAWVEALSDSVDLQQAGISNGEQSQCRGGAIRMHDGLKHRFELAAGLLWQICDHAAAAENI